VKLKYSKKINIEIGQTLYGIISVSRRTYDGVYPIVVDEIDWNNEEVIFKIEQPCEFVSCNFDEFEKYVFGNYEEAKSKEKELSFGEGLFEY